MRTTSALALTLGGALILPPVRAPAQDVNGNIDIPNTEERSIYNRPLPRGGSGNYVPGRPIPRVILPPPSPPRHPEEAAIGAYGRSGGLEDALPPREPPPGRGPSQPYPMPYSGVSEGQPRAYQIAPGSSFAVRAGNVVMDGAGGAGGKDPFGASNLPHQVNLGTAAANAAFQAAARPDSPGNLTVASGERWRFVWSGSRWWYKGVDDQWQYNDRGQWVRYVPPMAAGAVFPYSYRYGTAYRGYYDPGSYYSQPDINYYGPGRFYSPNPYLPSRTVGAGYYALPPR
jgi:hypothetical protein